MESRKIVILGSTGSIGRATLEVIIAHPGSFDIVALAANSNIELLEEQYHKHHPKYIAVVDEEKAASLAKQLKDEPVEILAGKDELVKLAGLGEVNLVVNAVVGAAGLQASFEAVKQGKFLALANKESLVTGGPLFAPLSKRNDGKILPIDSEHSAIWQALACGHPDEIKNIILTASGGPFRNYPRDKFDEITPEMALKHPTWKMGAKITIDSATLANKGLEVIEAVALFSVPADKIKVVVHPQSVIHSMVEYIDSSIIAQMSRPDMRLPITFALFWPERVVSDFGRLDFTEYGHLDFEEPDYLRFPLLKLAFKVAETGGTAPAVFNAANEVAVGAFLKRLIKFTGIVDIIDDALDNLKVVSKPSLEDILKADDLARKTAQKKIEELACY